MIPGSTGTIKLYAQKTALLENGSIQLVTKETAPVTATGSVTLHLLGQHDQGSHGHGGGGGNEGGGGGGVRADEETMAKIQSELDKPGSSVRAFQESNSSNGKIDTYKAKTTPELDKLEGELEVRRTEALEKFHNSTGPINQVKKYNEYADAENELIRTRNKMYSPSDHERIMGAEGNAYQLKTLGNIHPNEFERGIFEKSGVYWNDEVGRAKAEARGLPTEKLTQKLGDSFDKKKGEWPDPKPEPPRKIEMIAESKGIFRRETVDGVRVKRAYEIETANGDKIRVYDRAGGKMEDGIKLANSTAALHDLYPQKPPRKLVVLNHRQTIVMTGMQLGGFVFPGDDHIFINKQEVPKFTKAAKKGWMMPAGKTSDPGHYVLTHEFGHQYDAQNKRSGGRGLYEDKNIKRHLSTYGKSIPEEGYAEAFAEWHVSKGQTRNPAAVAYAKHEKWYGNERIVATPAGAKKYGVPIGQSIPEGVAAGGGRIELWGMEDIEVFEAPEEWDAWRIASELGIIRGSGDETEEDEMKDFPKDLPMIIETWDPGKKSGPVNYSGVGKATKEEKEEAERVIREVWDILGLDYED